MAVHAPRLANLGVSIPGLRALAKRAAGVHPKRSIPRFAKQTFRASCAERRSPAGAGGQRVILWPDTFNDAFNPAALDAAVEVLEAAGFTVDIPRVRLCCGRPLYDYGFLDEAKVGCCGMAGSFGFEAGHYDLAMQVGERVLLPAVRP